MAETSQTVEIEGHQLKLTNLDKVLYPATGMTKGEVLQYYLQIAPFILPYLEGRPATRKRWPDGVGEDGEHSLVFFTKNRDSGTPGWVQTRAIEHSDRTNHYPLIDDVATLIQLAQFAALELHVPQWRFDDQGNPQNPDRLVLDLDPGPGVELADCAEIARLARPLLESVGLAACPVTSGSKGIHLYARLDGSYTTQQASDIALEIARTLEQSHRDQVTSQMKKSLRDGKVFIDWSQNNGNKTTVAPYSLRGRRLPTVATPRSWDELDDPGLANLTWDAVLERVAEVGDLLAPIRGAGAEDVDTRALDDADVRSAEDRLSTYRGMRDAARTPEPVPADAPAASDGRSFVIQEHHATALHYDFRLERDGVLVSWAVPKGVPPTTTKNHLAVQTEDHPLEYGSFEGTIPKGECGGGEVTIWDAGTFDLHKWRPGEEVIVTLHGRPDGGLGGPVTVALIHTGKGDGTKPKAQWLMHRMKAAPDYFEDVETPPDISFPDPITPMLPTDADSVTGSGWSFEIDWDGERVTAALVHGHARLRDATGADLSTAHPEIVGALAGIDVGSAVLDGVLMRPSGGAVQLCVVDVLELEGESLLRTTLAERRARLEETLGQMSGRVQAPPSLPGDLDEALDAAAGMGAPGVIAKKISSVYQPGKRVKTWLRVRR